MIIYTPWNGITVSEYNQNLTDANRQGFFLTPLQLSSTNFENEVISRKIIILATIFGKQVKDAQRQIEFYCFNRLSLLPNGFDSLKDKIKIYFRLAVYKQIEYSQYNRGNFVENEGVVQFSQGTQSNIQTTPSSNIYASDNLCLEAKTLIDFTGIRTNRKVRWWKLITDEPLLYEE